MGAEGSDHNLIKVVVRIGLDLKMTLSKDLGSEGASHAVIWGRSFQAESIAVQVYQVRVFLTCFQSSREASMAGMNKEETVAGEVRSIMLPRAY